MNGPRPRPLPGHPARRIPANAPLLLLTLLLLAPGPLFAAFETEGAARPFRNENLMQHGVRAVEVRVPLGGDLPDTVRIEAAFENANLNALAADADFEPLLPDPDEYGEDAAIFLALGGEPVDPSRTGVMRRVVPDVAQLFFEDLAEPMREDDEPAPPPISFTLLDDLTESRTRMAAKVGAPAVEEPLRPEATTLLVERFLERKTDPQLRIAKKLELKKPAVVTGRRERDDASFEEELLRLSRAGGRGEAFRWPVVAKRISSRFGWRIHPIHRRRKFHNGVDFAANYGRPIVACGEGTVEYAGWKNYYGKTVIVRHPNGMKSLYAHCSKVHVNRGQRVKGGERIAAIGSTGLSTGPHLHFGIMRDGKFVNPLPLLR